jgi:hypothetical protein
LPCDFSFTQVGQQKSPARWKHHEAIDIPWGHVNRSSSVEQRGQVGSTTGGGVSIIPFEWKITPLIVFPIIHLQLRLLFQLLSCDTSQNFGLVVATPAEVQ